MTTTRQHLIAATKELLWERGYEATSPRAILERSGAGQGSLYHHFASKADLAAVALREVADEMREKYDKVLHSEKPALERIRDFLMMPRAELRGCRFGRMTQEQVTTQDILRDSLVLFFSYLDQELTNIIEEAKQEGTLSKSINSTELAATLSAVVQGGYVLARAFQDPERMHQAIRGAVTLIDSLEQR